MNGPTQPELVRIEDAGLNASAPREQRLLDGWLLRFSPGKAKRARCINAIGDGRLPLADKLALCEAAYAAAALPMIVRITPFNRPANLDAALDAGGFVAFEDTHVMWLPALDAIAVPKPLELRAVTGDEFAQVVGALRGSPAGQCAAHARRLRQAPVAHTGFVLERDGRALACGQFAIEDSLVGLYDIFTAVEARRQGLGGALCTQILLRAREQGARRAYLQVDAGNGVAIGLYERLGFRAAYAYHYRARPGAFA